MTGSPSASASPTAVAVRMSPVVAGSGLMVTEGASAFSCSSMNVRYRIIRNADFNDYPYHSALQYISYIVQDYEGGMYVSGDARIGFRLKRSIFD